MKMAPFIMLGLLTTAGTLFALGQSDDSANVVIMRVGDIENAANLGALALDRFAQDIEAGSGGGIEVRTFHASQLGSATKQLEMVKSGALEAFRGSISWLAQFDTGFSLTDFPFLCDSPQQARAIALSDAFASLNDKLADTHGIRFVTAGWTRLPRQLLLSTPISSAADLRNVKIRVPESYSYIESFKALGMTPTPVSFGETYLALNQKVVDGAENHVESLYNMKWYEGAKHLVVTNHSYDVTGFIVNDAWWQSLSPEYRRLIIDTFDSIDVWYAAENAALEGRYIDLMEEEGVTVHRVDTEQLRKIVQPAAVIQAERDGKWDAGLWAEIELILTNRP